MTPIDWSPERIGPSDLELLNSAPESEGIDLVAVRRYRQDRVRHEMERRAIDAVILSDPVNIRYATGTRNMQIFSSRNTPARYLLLTADRSILFEFTGCEHLAHGFETVDEVRPARTASFCAAGPAIASREIEWAREMAALVGQLVGPEATVGLERMNAGAALALADQGLRVVDGQEPVEMARSVKSSEEIKCIEASLRATEVAVGKLREAIRPGMIETELWSIMVQSVLEQNGDYCETRLLNSGYRSNPWFREATHHVIEPNTLIALDTDVVGCHGYYSDFSRTFHAGPDEPSAEQRLLYRTALEQIEHNISILRPGLTFGQYAEQAWDIPEEFHANRYYLSAHGNGMTGEYPYLYHRGDYAEAGYDGEIVPNMTICVESFIGRQGGANGVKLEQQVLVTETGVEILSRFPFEDDLIQ